MSQLLIYGANGYTGKLIAHEAAKRGLKALLGGRQRDAISALADELSLPCRVFELDNADEVARNLDGVAVVLHCAGPFSRTSAPMLKACLDRNVHYLDITGEVDVFEACHRADARAKTQGTVVMPGSGFDVVPTDCLAALLKRRLPDATRGTLVDVEGPLGTFTFPEPPGQPQLLFVAGGTGIAPLRAMIDHAIRHHPPGCLLQHDFCSEMPDFLAGGNARRG